MSGKEIPIKPLNDKLDYKYIRFDNGFKALLISDPTYKQLKASDKPTIKAEKSRSESNRSTKSINENEGLSRSDSRKGWSHFHKPSKNPPKRSPTGEKLSSLFLCVRSGSFDEPKTCPGLAHLVEHLVPCRSKTYPVSDSLDKFLDDSNGYHNAITEYEYTFFRIEVPRMHLQESLLRFSKCFAEPLVRTKTIEKEIKMVDDEFSSTKPDHILCEQILCSIANDGHPMNGFCWGNKKSLKSVDNIKELVREFMAKHYTPDNIHIVVQSQTSLTQLEEWIRNFFGVLKPEVKRIEVTKKWDTPFESNRRFNRYYLVNSRKSHDLIIMWCLPPTSDQHLTCPLDYWYHLIRWEGKGGLVSKLWERELLSDFGLKRNKFSNTFLRNRFSSSIAIVLPLSEKGESNINYVIEYVFEYLQMLRQLGPQEWLFNELKQIEDNRFNWAEEERAVEHVKRIALNMNVLPTIENVLQGKRLYKKFDKELLQLIIDYMKPQNACFIRLGKDIIKSISEAKTKTEKWFETKYKVRSVPEEWLKEQNIVNNRFSFPEPNPFIAATFDLKNNPENNSRYPQKIIDENRLKVWYKSGAEFETPKAIVKIHLVCPLISDSIGTAVLSDFFVELVNFNLNEDMSYANMAHIHWKVSATVTGIIVTVDGLNDKLCDVLDFLMIKLKQINIRDEQELEEIKDIVSKKVSQEVSITKDVKQFTPLIDCVQQFL